MECVIIAKYTNRDKLFLKKSGCIKVLFRADSDKPQMFRSENTEQCEQGGDMQRMSEQIDRIDLQIQFGQDSNQSNAHNHQEDEVQEPIVDTMKSLQAAELLKLYADSQFLKLLLAHHQDYPLQTNQILCRITYLLTQLLLLIQNHLLQQTLLNNSLILSLKQVQQAAYRLVEFELSQTSQSNLSTLQEVKQKMVQMFESGRIEGQGRMIVYSFMIGVWKSPLNFHLSMQLSNQSKQISIQTDPIDMIQDVQKIKIPPPTTPTAALPYQPAHTTSLLNQANLKQQVASTNLNSLTQTKTPTPIKSFNKALNQPICQDQPAIMNQSNYSNKPLFQNRFKRQLPRMSNSVKLNREMTEFSQLIKLEKQNIRKPFQRRLNFAACLPKNTYIQQEQPPTTIIKQLSQSIKQSPARVNKNQHKLPEYKQIKASRQRWTPQQQSILINTFVVRGNLQECSNRLKEHFQSQNSKYCMDGVKQRINLLVHRVYDKLCSLNSKNSNILKFKSNWNFIRKKSTLSGRRKVYINMVGIYAAMLNMSQGKAKTISQKVLQINAICAQEQSAVSLCHPVKEEGLAAGSSDK